MAGILRTNNGEALLGRTLCILVINYETLLGHFFFVCVCVFFYVFIFQQYQFHLFMFS